MAITLHTDVQELPEQTELVVGRRRDEFQQMVDADVEKLKLATAKAGWPEPDPARLFHRYVTDAADLTALKGIIRRAGTLHRVEAEFYKDAKTEGGHVVVKFHVARKTDADGNPVKDETLDAEGKPVAPAKAKAE